MLTGVIGLPGAGKSLFLLSYLEAAVRGGRDVWTNLRIKECCPYFDQVHVMDDDFQRVEWMGKKYMGSRYPVFQEPDGVDGVPFRAFWHFCPPGAVIIIDEIDNYLESGDWAKLRGVGREAHLYWKMHRKLGHDVCFTVQKLENLWVKVRRQTQEWVMCESDWRVLHPLLVRWMPDWALRFRRWRYQDEKLKVELDAGTWTRREASRYFSWYDTKQILGPAQLTRWGKDTLNVVGEIGGDGAANLRGNTGGVAGTSGQDVVAGASGVPCGDSWGDMGLAECVGDVEDDASECIGEQSGA